MRRADGVSEHFQIQQNRPLLERLSDMTGGRYFALGGLDALPEAIQFSEAGIVERELLDLWNMPIVFLLLLLLKAGEWPRRNNTRTHWPEYDSDREMGGVDLYSVYYAGCHHLQLPTCGKPAL